MAEHEWVSDRLHDILGLSDKHLVEFLIKAARKAKSSNDILRDLKKRGGLVLDDKMTSFILQLWKFCSPFGQRSSEAAPKVRQATNMNAL